MLDQWHELCVRLGALADTTRSKFANEIYNDLVTRYTAADRHYHNLVHIAACLEEFENARSLARDPLPVQWALWFHDAVYDSHRPDNEEKSADLARAAGQRLGMQRNVLENVSHMILATKHQNAPLDGDKAFLVDIDLSILGKPEAEFDQYERGIRAEYAWVDEVAFRQGRSEVLRRFLDRERIYVTDHFYLRYEAAARRNLRRSLDQLTT